MDSNKKPWKVLLDVAREKLEDVLNEHTKEGYQLFKLVDTVTEYSDSMLHASETRYDVILVHPSLITQGQMAGMAEVLKSSGFDFSNFTPKP